MRFYLSKSCKLLLSNAKELQQHDIQNFTEVKFENTINRATSVANPRQIERAVRGSIFDMELLYEVVNEQEVLDDISLLAEGMKLLEYDYLGGNGSRGYGKVKFLNVEAESVIGDLGDLAEKCDAIFKKALG